MQIPMLIYLNGKNIVGMNRQQFLMKIYEMRLSVSFIIIVILSICISGTVQAMPYGWIGMNQSMQTAYVTGTENATVLFTGYVDMNYISSASNETYILRFSSEAGDWNTKIIPQEMSYNTTAVDNPTFQVFVIVPSRTSSSDTRELVITVGVENELGQIFRQETKALINVRQYYNFSLETPKPEITVVEGDQFIFLVKVTNLGNGQDTIRLEIRNRAELEKKWVACMLSTTDIILDEENDSVAKISVTLPYDRDLRKINIHFSAYSFESLYNYNISIERNLTFVIVVKSDYMPEMAILCCIALPVIIIVSVLSVIILTATERRKLKRR